LFARIAQQAGGTGSATVDDNEKLGTETTDNGVLLEKTDKFCYLGDMAKANGGSDSAVTARLSTSKTFFQKGFLLKL